MADEAYISFEQAAERLGIDEDQLLDLVASNELQAVRVNRETMFKTADIEAFASREVDTNVSLDSVDLEDLPDDIVLLGGDTPPGGIAPLPDDTPTDPLKDESGELLDLEEAGAVLLPEESGELLATEGAQAEEPEAGGDMELPEEADAGAVRQAPVGEGTPASDTSDFLAEIEEESGFEIPVSDETDSFFDEAGEEDAGDGSKVPDDSSGELLDADDAGVELLDVGEVVEELPDVSEEGDDQDAGEGMEELESAPEEDDFLEDGGGGFIDEVADGEGEAENNQDVGAEDLKESGEVGEMDLEESAQMGRDAEAEIPMTERDEFDDETEPLMDAPSDEDGLGTEEILFDDEDLEIGEDGFGIGTEEATIQEDALIDDEDGEDEKTLLVDEDDEEGATLITDDLGEDDEDEDGDEEEDAPSARSSRRGGGAGGRGGKRPSTSSVRRRPTMSAGKSSEQASNLVWAGLMMLLVIFMFYPIFLYALMIWKGVTDSQEQFAPIQFGERVTLKNVGAIVQHDWFEWFPRWEIGEEKVPPRAWWGYPPRFTEGVTNPGDPATFDTVENRVGQLAVRAPVDGAHVPSAFEESPVLDDAEGSGGSGDAGAPDDGTSEWE